MKLKKYSQMLAIGTLLIGSVSSGIVYGEESIMSTTDSTISSTPPLVSESTVETTTTTTDTTVESTTESTTESTAEMITEPTTENTKEESTSASSEVEMETSDYQAPVTQVSIINGIEGDGTESAPFQVTTFSQMSSVASMVSTKNYYTVTNAGTVYIKLMDDITSDGSGAAFSKNTYPIIIDGTAPTGKGVNGKFSIFYTGGITNSGGIFSLGSSNVNITFSNLNFGSKNSPKSTYYGFCTSTADNNTMNIKNVDYYAETGGQPFYWTGSGSVLNFSGQNSFEVPFPGSESEEFAEIRGTLNFEDESTTNIIHKTDEERGIFWLYSGNPVVFNVGTSATLNITSGKRYLFWDDSKPIINIAENGQFNYINDTGYIKNGVQSNTGQNDNTLTAGSKDISVTLEKNAKMTFSAKSYTSGKAVTSNALNPKNLIITSKDSGLVSFTNELPENPALSSASSMTITNSTSTNSIYSFRKTGISSKNNAVTNELIMPNVVIKSIPSITDYNSLLYTPAITVEGITAEGTSGAGFSQIESAMTDVKNYLDDTYTVNAQYYVTQGSDPDNSLVIDPTDNTINASGDHTNGQLSFTPSDITNPTSLTKDLVSGDYKVYGRMQIMSENAAPVYTPWQSTTTTVPAYQSVTIPSKIDLNEDDIISYGKRNDRLGIQFDPMKQFMITNQGNQAVNVTPTAIVKKPLSDVTIVPITKDPLASQELSLNFNFGNDTVWDLGGLTTAKAMVVEPYWSEERRQSFYLSGDYGGPIITSSVANLDYNLQLAFQWGGVNQ